MFLDDNLTRNKVWNLIFYLLNFHCLRHSALLLQSINHDHNSFIMKFVFQKAAIPIANCLGQVKFVFHWALLYPGIDASNGETLEQSLLLG